jgi:hypothetical protein
MRTRPEPDPDPNLRSFRSAETSLATLCATPMTRAGTGLMSGTKEKSAVRCSVGRARSGNKITTALLAIPWTSVRLAIPCETEVLAIWLRLAGVASRPNGPTATRS